MFLSLMHVPGFISNLDQMETRNGNRHGQQKVRMLYLKTIQRTRSWDRVSVTR